jgi:hypothetical protein
VFTDRFESNGYWMAGSKLFTRRPGLHRHPISVTFKTIRKHRGYNLGTTQPIRNSIRPNWRQSESRFRGAPASRFPLVFFHHHVRHDGG